MIESNITVCILLWLFFGFQHSLLARPSTKTILSKLINDTFVIYFYPLIYFISQCIIFFAIYDIIRHLEPKVIFFSASEKFEIIIFWLNRISNLFLIITVFHFDIGRFTGLSQFILYFYNLLKKVEKKNEVDKLNSKYLYKYIRHPMYLGILLVFGTSTSIYTELFLINFICILLYVEIGSFFEEKSLLEKFGNSYKKYQNSTKKYIPFLR